MTKYEAQHRKTKSYFLMLFDTQHLVHWFFIAVRATRYGKYRICSVGAEKPIKAQREAVNEAWDQHVSKLLSEEPLNTQWLLHKQWLG